MMVTGLAPVVGIPLPLVSYGGSAMMTVLILLGIVMGLARGGQCAADPLDRARKRVVTAPLASASGRIAQSVEQLTLNQRVPGSNPGASTKLSN